MTELSAAGLLALFASLTGCVAAQPMEPVGPVPASLTPARYEVMQRVAATHLNCAKDQLAYESFQGSRHLFRGCGVESEMLLLEGADAKAYGPGYELVAVPSPTFRFGKETGCGREQTRWERVDFRTYIVAGCGKRITYLNACSRAGCSWVADVVSTGR